MLLETLSGLTVGLVTVAVYIRHRIASKFGSHDSSNEENVEGKIVLITGGNSGLGKETALEMAKRGAIIILASRNVTLTDKVIEDIRKVTSNGKLVNMKLDLGSLQSIRSFAEEVKKNYDRIHILINNAGVFCPLKKALKTAEGFEFNFGVNHLGHFLLTNLLLDEIKKAAPSRVVVVASLLSESGKINFDDLMLEKVNPEDESMPGRRGITSFSAYGNSKLSNVLFARELAARVAGTGVHTYALCPGWVKTDLGRYMDLSWKSYIMMIPFAAMLMRTPHQGAQTILHCSLSKECAIETGKLYRNCSHWVTKSNISDNIAKRLWDVSEELVQLKK